MICVQNAAPSSSSKRILIASDLANTQAAAQETADWLRAHGYQMASNARPLLVYEHGVCVRQWMQVEPLPVGGSPAASFPAPTPPPFRAWFSSLLPFRQPSSHQQIV